MKKKKNPLAFFPLPHTKTGVTLLFFSCILISIRLSEVAVYFPWQGYIGRCCHHTGKKTQPYEPYTEQWVRVQFKHDIKGTCCYYIILSLTIAASTILSSAVRPTLCENLPDTLSKSNRIEGVAKKIFFYQEPGFHLLRWHLKSTWFLASRVEFKVKKEKKRKVGQRPFDGEFFAFIKPIYHVCHFEYTAASEGVDISPLCLIIAAAICQVQVFFLFHIIFSPAVIPYPQFTADVSAFRLIGFHSSQCSCSHWMLMQCGSGPSQIRWSGALWSRTFIFAGCRMQNA